MSVFYSCFLLCSHIFHQSPLHSFVFFHMYEISAPVHRFDSVYIFRANSPIQKHGKEGVAIAGRCFFLACMAYCTLGRVAVSVRYETLHGRMIFHMYSKTLELSFTCFFCNFGQTWCMSPKIQFLIFHLNLNLFSSPHENLCMHGNIF